MLRHAAASVFHYFKNELNRETVTVGEFAVALEKALRNLGLTIRADEFGSHSQEIIEADLGLFARESDGQPGTVFLPAPARRTARRNSAIRRACALSRPARLRQAACRRATLEHSLRKIAGTNR